MEGHLRTVHYVYCTAVPKLRDQDAIEELELPGGPKGHVIMKCGTVAGWITLTRVKRITHVKWLGHSAKYSTLYYNYYRKFIQNLQHH